MTLLVALFGVAVAGVGLLGLLRPDQLLRLVRLPWNSPRGLYFAIGLRIVLGFALIAAAAESRFPEAFRILGILSLIGAALIPLLGFARMLRFIEWWVARPTGFIRGWSGVAVGFGLFLVYGAL